MALTPAPFYNDLAGGPAGGAAYWCKTADAKRIRVGFWPCESAKGTVLLFPGRTEYIEKYGHAAGEFAQRGYATLTVDWRGQGLADRLFADRRVGHVGRFTDFQKDVDAALQLAQTLGAPRPWYLVGHSMGGAIGLRATMKGLPVNACAFTGPMWGIHMSAALRPLGWALPRIARPLGFGTRLAPGTRFENYVTVNGFEGNMLTTDPEMFAMMQAHLSARPDLGLGGPSLTWLGESLTECAHLSRQPSPDLPCVTFVGSGEQIIDTRAVSARMQQWPKGALEVVDGAQHEVLMETPSIRARVFDRMADLFAANA